MSSSSSSSAVPQLLAKKLTPQSILPTKGSQYAAGWDLYTSTATTIPAHGKALVPTGISIALPYGTYGRIAPRSGLSWRYFTATGAGVIDADYRGEVLVMLFNFSNNDLVLQVGDRAAQLILEKYETEAVLVEVDTLPDTVRGSGGFGSTGH